MFHQYFLFNQLKTDGRNIEAIKLMALCLPIYFRLLS